jgi:hypothetical protein
VEERGNPDGNVAQSQIPCRREGDSLRWSYETHDEQFRITGVCALRINSSGTADLAEERTYQVGDKPVYKMTGTLVRQ